MTFSMLVRDPATGALGGAAATGNLCVGAWVLRGDARAGLTASQGLYPNPMWSLRVLDLICAGGDAGEAVRQVALADEGRELRQFAVVDLNGRTAVHNGARNLEYSGNIAADGLIAAGNMLASQSVLEAMVEAFASATDALPARLIAALASGAAAGGDLRGLISAAVLVLAPDEPPIDLRVDAAADPVHALRDLYGRTLEAGYQDWLRHIPTVNDPQRGP